jgi:hypothetical protein
MKTNLKQDAVLQMLRMFFEQTFEGEEPVDQALRVVETIDA